MAAIQSALVVAQRALPKLAKMLPKLWPLLLDPKNREKVMSLIGDLATASPKRKLAARMGITEVLAQTLVEQAEDDEERRRGAEWQVRAKKLRIRLDMPVGGRKQRRAHRAALREDLATLHEEMSESLRG